MLLHETMRADDDVTFVPKPEHSDTTRAFEFPDTVRQVPAFLLVAWRSMFSTMDQETQKTCKVFRGPLLLLGHEVMERAPSLRRQCIQATRSAFHRQGRNNNGHDLTYKLKRKETTGESTLESPGMRQRRAQGFLASWSGLLEHSPSPGGLIFQTVSGILWVGDSLDAVERISSDG